MLNSARTFGVEIETSLPRELHPDFPAVNHRGTPVNGSPVTASGKPWVAKTDASLIAAPGCYPAEIVSPVLTGTDGLIDTLVYLDFLNEYGARSNNSCGLHIHIGARDLSPQARAEFVRMFVAFERAFYALNGVQTQYRYNESGYCAPSSRWVAQYGASYSDKYQSLNWNKLEQYGTFEFRLYSGQIIAHPSIVLLTIILGVALADAVAQGDTLGYTPTCTDPAGLLGELFSVLNLKSPDMVKDFLPAAQEQARLARFDRA